MWIENFPRAGYIGKIVVSSVSGRKTNNLIDNYERAEQSHVFQQLSTIKCLGLSTMSAILTENGREYGTSKQSYHETPKWNLEFHQRWK